MRKHRKLFFIVICFSFSWIIFLVRGVLAGDEKALNVAIFTDPQATAENCVQATVNILKTNGFNVKTITGRAIREGGLNGFDVIMFPGGSGSGEARALGQTGCAAVEQFVKSGGGYIGTCAGGYLGAKGYSVKGADTSATSWLELVNAEIVDADHWARGTGKVEVRIVDATHPILEGFSGTIKAQYINGPIFKPGSDPNLVSYKELAVFVSDLYSSGGASPGVMPGTTALLTSTYGDGRCVLFSFHPELTAGLEMMVVRAVQWVEGI